jgi:hypothetical protein
MALSDDRCEYCGGSIRQGAEPQRFVAVAAAAAARRPDIEPAAKIDDAGFCSDGCRQSYGRALIVTEPIVIEAIAHTAPVVPSDEYEYEVLATEADGTEHRFNYLHHAPEPLGVGATFSVRHGALDLVSIYRVTREVSDRTVEAEWFTGGGPRYPSEPSR